MKIIDLVIHDWRNLRPEERAQAIADVKDLAQKIIATDHRRGRALNIVASFLGFLEQP